MSNLPLLLPLGVASIEREHKALITNLDLLIRSPRAKPESVHVIEILTKLGDQLASHFDHEEAMIKSLGIPADEICRHVQAHSEIIEEFTQLNFDLMSGKGIDLDALVAMIKKWIVDHLADYDLKIDLDLAARCALAGH